MSAEDWDSKVVIGHRTHAPRVAKDEKTVNAAKRAGSSIETAKKTVANTAHSGPDHQRIAKLDRENDVAPPPKVKLSVGKAMSDARIKLKLNQKDLAVMVSEKPSVINDYEAGRAVPNPQVLAKFERILKVKLRGNNIGSPLAPPQKKA
ncbi:hypothetical protein O181_036555 [Austropuccinia psidii MF-1]|uniref:HTH cro/C1-type domain-containing protein n=1 Tax=Austropuccinia psidii MF-1 TaxID=1389203 RepID=A0A9Q3HCA6_9BASI|nr:hypothetical protein [Austropuccinia psidii MF-1]